MSSYYLMHTQSGALSQSARNDGEHACTSGLSPFTNPLISIYHPAGSRVPVEQLEEYMTEACSLFPWLPRWGVGYKFGRGKDDAEALQVIDMTGQSLSELHLFIVYARLAWEFNWELFWELRKEYGLQWALILYMLPQYNNHTMFSCGHRDVTKEASFILNPSLWKKDESTDVIVTGRISWHQSYMGYFAGTGQRNSNIALHKFTSYKEKMDHVLEEIAKRG